MNLQYITNQFLYAKSILEKRTITICQKTTEYLFSNIN